MKYIGKNKYTIVVIILFIIVLVLGLNARNILLPNAGKPLYGNRLTDIDNVKIKNNQYDNLKDTLGNEEIVTNISYELTGKRLDVTLTVKDDASIEASKAVGVRVLEFFDDAQKGYYDFQVFINKQDPAQNNFPIIGYKHRTRGEFIWTKDRQVSEIHEEQ